MRAFATLEEASAYLAPLLDQPVTAEHLELTPHIQFRAEPVGLGGGSFTNSYTISWSSPAASEIFVAEPPMCTAEYARQRDAVVTATGGFFFLADRCRYRPRTLSLNLAVRNGKVLSLPAADQDALVDDGGTLSVVEVPARGELSLDGHTLRWTGTRTGVEADCYAYGNANCVIEHEPDAHTGKVRTLREDSRLTPEITGHHWSDLGFTAARGGRFEATALSDHGRLDIFDHDIVLRCPRRLARVGSVLEPRTIGPLSLRPSLRGAISVGPSLFHPDPQAHPLNGDRSLGSFPLLKDRPSTRLVFYGTADGRRHLRLFDGRPGSPTFPGVGLDQAISLVLAGGDVTTGCLLDSGHSCRLNVRRGGNVTSFGNRHYLRWPTERDPRFVWNPDHGRQVASLIALR
ncbi:hypothetical protein SBI_07255 [Streptomyces bingchenggensis BCW-1]|uniref:Uncharacterized protein n=1 Tax=Streptomyces bingchenggensis (strain BCW-1) TaxID=749414 RepID=D7C5I7_STRBB|nr:MULTISPECIES: hypothetical protein [Streptomyces]ADI10375.1 hypothetical protein SBI_07255 [Streptomyces bingchenggensis BCW-1]